MSGVLRVPTHSQYEELRLFADGLAHMWLYGAPSTTQSPNRPPRLGGALLIGHRSTPLGYQFFAEVLTRPQSDTSHQMPGRRLGRFGDQFGSGCSALRPRERVLLAAPSCAIEQIAEHRVPVAASVPAPDVFIAVALKPLVRDAVMDATNGVLEQGKGLEVASRLSDAAAEGER